MSYNRCENVEGGILDVVAKRLHKNGAGLSLEMADLDAPNATTKFTENLMNMRDAKISSKKYPETPSPSVDDQEVLLNIYNRSPCPNPKQQMVLRSGNKKNDMKKSKRVSKILKRYPSSKFHEKIPKRSYQKFKSYSAAKKYHTPFEPIHQDGISPFLLLNSLLGTNFLFVTHKEVAVEDYVWRVWRELTTKTPPLCIRGDPTGWFFEFGSDQDGD